MTKKLLLILSIFTATLTAQTTNQCCNEGCNECHSECSYLDSRLFYVKMGPAAMAIGSHTGIGAALYGGLRIMSEHGAADISFAYFGGLNADDHSTYAYLAPSIRYLQYINPRARRGLYFGGGLGWGEIKSESEKFSGMMVHASAGYDLLRTRRLRQFIELDVLQPIVRTGRNKHGYTHSYAPALSVTFGIGF